MRDRQTNNCSNCRQHRRSQQVSRINIDRNNCDDPAKGTIGRVAIKLLVSHTLLFFFMDGSLSYS